MGNLKSNMSMGVQVMYLLGGVVRYCLMHSQLAEAITSRVEVSTPINAWLRAKEGAFLHSQGIEVYSGGVYHGTPLELLFTKTLLQYYMKYIPYIYILIDLITAFLLSEVALEYTKQLLNSQKKEKSKYSKDSSIMMLQPEDLFCSSNFVVGAYLFCPYTIFSCVGKTSTVWANLFLAISLYFMVKGNSLLFGMATAICTYQSLYPVCLLIPGMIEDSKFPLTKIIQVLASFLVTCTMLLWCSVRISGNLDFIEATYGFILLAPDLTPNIGLFWYFFTEMFEHFRLFFLAIFQINAFIYLLPLAIKLRPDPMLLSFALVSLTAVFRSYPSLGDVGFYLALLPMWKHLYVYLRQKFVVGCMLVASSVLGPIMYNLWIFSGSANANFYFAITLTFNVAQIFLITDLLFANVKRQYHLYNGSSVELDGQPATLVLE